MAQSLAQQNKVEQEASREEQNVSSDDDAALDELTAHPAHPVDSVQDEVVALTDNVDAENCFTMGNTVDAPSVPTSALPDNHVIANVAKFLRLRKVKFGDKVQCRYRQSNEFFPAEVTGVSTVSGDIVYDVHYEDGETDTQVPRMNLRYSGEKQVPVLAIGNKVHARVNEGLRPKNKNSRY